MKEIPVSLLKSFCDCEKCQLYKDAKNPYIPSRGQLDNPEICLIGEAPGKWEDEKGYCFAHTSGENLKKALGWLVFDNSRLLNICRCVPWENKEKGKVRAPTDLEISCCKPWIEIEISKFPENTIIVPMGNTALKAFFPENSGIMKEMGIPRKLEVRGKIFTFVPSLHPASVGYRPALKDLFYNTFSEILDKKERGIYD